MKNMTIEDIRLKARQSIDSVLNKYLNNSWLKQQFESKCESWRYELIVLEGKNPFDLTDEEIDKKIYLNEIIRYGTSTMCTHKINFKN
jgi:hypothetical protein